MWRSPWLLLLWLGAVTSCTAVLGIDEDYELASTTSHSTGSGTPTASSSTAGAGGAPTGTAGSGGAALPDGSPCEEAALCASDHCVDAVCCGSVCDDTCEACAQSLTGQPDGTCAPTSAYLDPDTDCSEGQACDGAGACKRIDGEACNQDGQCISGNCDGDACAP